jgi:POT family proton-dependent oligopeptide transporter
MRHPPGLGYIVGNEAAERFSYYGMKSILVVFMTTQLMTRAGAPDSMSSSEATFWYHIFTMGNYLFPLVGALLADVVWGKYPTIIWLSLVYCLGHFVLALDSTRIGLLVGLALIAIGAGGIKPCVSAHLGDQYRGEQSASISEGYSLFYIAINIGAFASSLLIPWLLEVHGAHVAFGVPGIFMALATLVFWLGRHRYQRVPPTRWSDYVRDLMQPEKRRALRHLALIFVTVAAFWALFDQIGSSWILQAERMDRTIRVPLIGEVTILASQIQAINPLLILLLTPTFAWWVYPWCERRGLLSLPSRITVGMVLAGGAFGIVALAQYWLVQSMDVSIGWQVLAYVLLTVAEVMVSVTTLELTYTHSPRVSKSFVTSFYLLSVALGNGVAAVYNGFLVGVFGGPETVSYFAFFAVLPVIASVGAWGVLRTLRAEWRH